MYMCIHTHTHTPLSHFAIHLKLTQHCKSTIYIVNQLIFFFNKKNKTKNPVG